MERRKGYGAADDALLRARMTGTYKALPSSASAAASLAEQRRMEIQVSHNLFDFKSFLGVKISWRRYGTYALGTWIRLFIIK